MSLREKYLKVLSRVSSAGTVGVSLLLGSTMPSMANPDPVATPPAGHEAHVAERLAAIRDAVSTIARQETAGTDKNAGKMQLAWGNWWRNWGWRPWSPRWGWGWPNWNNWHNWNNWPNWWRNW
jgi:hypothetical protein